MEALTCTCCGAPINRSTYKCDYCGTQYKRPTENITQLVVERPGIKVLGTDVKVDLYDFKSLGPELLTNEVKWQSIQQMAEMLIPLVEVYTMPDPKDLTMRVRTRLRVVEPGRNL